MKTQIIILAAGKGTRMNSHLPKVLMPLKGKPMISYLLRSIKKLKNGFRVAIIIGHQKDVVRKYLGNNYLYIIQNKRLGTGHAVGCAEKYLKNKSRYILVLNGDHPFIKAETIKKIIDLHAKSENTITMGTVKLNDFKSWRKLFRRWGRIIRDKKQRINGIMEFKDANSRQKLIREVNPTIFCFESGWLWTNIKKLNNNNKQKEYYLTDLIHLAIKQNKKVGGVNCRPEQTIGINSQEELKLAEKFL